jgi:hypothetical protein
MSWLYSQALVEAYSGATCSDGEQSVQSSGNPTQLAYLLPDKMTDFCRLSRFGMTFRPLTADRGEALLTSYLEAFHAKTSALQDEATDLKASGQECGNTWRGWLAKYDQDSCSWRTPQCSLLEEEPESLQTLPRWGMTVDGVLLERQTVALRTNGTESGLWRTPQAQDGMRGVYKTKEAIDAHLNRGHQLGLANQVAHRHLWPTPTVCGNYNRKGLSKTSGDGLATAVQRWPTPTAHMAKETNAPSEALRNEPSLTSLVGGTLNPTWVEWLMGWPLGWTDLKPLETDKFQQWQQQHGDY